MKEDKKDVMELLDSELELVSGGTGTDDTPNSTNRVQWESRTLWKNSLTTKEDDK